MAVSFWPVAASREALRAGMMPFFAASAALFFWLLYAARAAEKDGVPPLLAIVFSLCA
jgi:hypothetical protein